MFVVFMILYTANFINFFIYCEFLFIIFFKLSKKFINIFIITTCSLLFCNYSSHFSGVLRRYSSISSIVSCSICGFISFVICSSISYSHCLYFDSFSSYTILFIILTIPCSISFHIFLLQIINIKFN